MREDGGRECHYTAVCADGPVHPKAAHGRFQPGDLPCEEDETVESDDGEADELRGRGDEVRFRGSDVDPHERGFDTLGEE